MQRRVWQRHVTTACAHFAEREKYFSDQSPMVEFEQMLVSGVPTPAGLPAVKWRMLPLVNNAVFHRQWKLTAMGLVAATR